MSNERQRALREVSELLTEQIEACKNFSRGHLIIGAQSAEAIERLANAVAVLDGRSEDDDA